MTELKKRVIGALIGLARATDGNEHLITPESTATMAACLGSDPQNEEQLLKLLLDIEGAKRAMVPDCFLCANPCGRTASYDMDLLGQEPEEIRQLKVKLLEALFVYAQEEAYDEKLLYMTLIVVGIEDYSAENLKLLLERISK